MPVHHHHRIGGRLEQAAVAGLGGLPRADVADGRGDEDALGALERAEHDLDRELAAVPAQGDELDPGADLLGQGVGRRAQVVGDDPLGEALRDDVRDRLADELVTAVAELLLGLDVEQDDLAMPVHHHHRIGGRFEQAAVAGLGGLPRADVADGRGDEDALGALERAEHDLDRELAAVPALGDELDPGADLLGQGVGRRAQVVGDDPLGEAFRDDVGDRLADELVTAVAELLLGLDVEQHDLAMPVHHHHRIGGRFEQAAVAGFGGLGHGGLLV